MYAVERVRHIPDDVWMHIAQFIPEDHVKTLFSVNQAFFHLAMNARYHTVLLRDIDVATFKLVLRLQNVLVAKRVRYLRIHPLQIDWWSDGCAKKPEEFVQQVALKVLLPESTTVEFDWSNSTREFLRLATQAISNMQSVARCTWTLPYNSSSFQLPPNFFPTWSPSCHHLEQLDLHIPFKNLSSAHGLESVFFPCLRDLSVFIDDTEWLPLKPEETTGPQARDIIALFISRTNPTLKRLNIHIASKFRPSFFGKLGHFAQLIKLELTIPIFVHEYKSECKITRFITEHAATLEYFAFAVPQHEITESIQEGIERIFSIDPQIKFPRLRTLELNCEPVWPWSGISFATCIRPFVDTITTLILKDQYLSKTALDVISSAFTRNPGLVTTAWFRVDYLGPCMVDLLAERFPNLTDLTLTAPHMLADDHDMPYGFSSSSEDDFCKAMERRTYPRWLLRNLTIFFCPGCCCNTLSWRAMAAMARSVPSILSFNNQGDMKMPDCPAQFAVEKFTRINCECNGRWESG